MARTIFLIVRGIDQTGRIFEKSAKDLNNLQRMQQKVSRGATRLLFAGAAFGLFASKAAAGIFSLIERTSQGSLVMGDFNTSFNRLKDSFGEKLTDEASPVIDNLIKRMDDLTGREGTLSWLADITIKATIGIAAVGVGLGMLGLLAKIGFAPASSLLAALGLIQAAPAGPTALYEALVAGGALGGETAAAGGGLIAGAIQLAVPIVITLVIAWAFKYALEAGTRNQAIQKFIEEEGPAGPFAMGREDLMRDLGFSGTNPADIGSEWGLGISTRPIIINQDIHDNIIGDESDAGRIVGEPTAQEILDITDGS